jgi:hypothetical protein
MHDGA